MGLGQRSIDSLFPVRHRTSIWQFQRCDKFRCRKRARPNCSRCSRISRHFDANSWDGFSRNQLEKFNPPVIYMFRAFPRRLQSPKDQQDSNEKSIFKIPFGFSRFFLIFLVLRFTEAASELFIHFRIVSCFMTGRLGTHSADLQHNLISKCCATFSPADFMFECSIVVLICYQPLSSIPFS